MDDGTKRAVVAASTEPGRGWTRVTLGDRAGLLGLLLRNQLLMVVTLSFYRFWARTRLRRFLWSRVRIDGDGLEYTGRGDELFAGFLKAMVLLVPIFAVFGVVEAMLDVGSRWIILEKAVYFTVLLGLVAVAQFHARRYRLSRTLWRGIRFAQSGSAWDYARLSLGWTLATAATLGLAYPWMRWAQYRYLMRRSAFGGCDAQFEGSVAPLVKAWIPVLVPALPAVGGFGLAALAESGLLDPTSNWFEFADGAVPGLAMILGVPLAALTYVRYRVREFRAVCEATRLGEARFRSEARSGPVIGLFALFVVAMIVLTVAALSLMWWLGSSLGTFHVQAGLGPVTTLIAIGVGLFAIAGLLWSRIVVCGTLLLLAESVSIDRIDDLARIAQSDQPVPTTGEGLADSFDVG